MYDNNTDRITGMVLVYFFNLIINYNRTIENNVNFEWSNNRGTELFYLKYLTLLG